ncbi:MAG: GreA/GreB family elongation factor, partial [Leptospiraceae bacterium]|nr:GreA/GreB family elongation factor [Leptospiraceae bacterium]
DADTEKKIISYESPLARALIGKSVGETAQLDSGKNFVVERIESAL